MKKILGLDIGTTSIGWAIVEAVEEKRANEITVEKPETVINNDRIGIFKDAIGVRIISQDTDNISSFKEGKKLIQGSTLTPAAKRRKARGSRRMKSRYKLRRDKLIVVLKELGMLPKGAVFREKDEQGEWEEIRTNSNYYSNTKGKRGKGNDIGKELYELRNRATDSRIELNEWGRIFLHLNQWRGYSSDRFKKDDDENADDDFYTSLVISVGEKNRVYKGKKNPKVDKVIFEVQFDNGDIGLDIVPFGENSYSRFKLNEFATYKKTIQENEDGTKDLIFNWQKLKEDDWKYKKWKLNKGIDTYINIDKKSRTVGSYFYKFFYNSNTPQEDRLDRIRNNVVNRDWYEDEFDKIWDFQFERHKEHFEKINIEDVVKTAFKDYQAILNEVSKKQEIKEQLRYLIKDKIIYYQRPWQQAKNKGECPFEFVPDVTPKKDASGKQALNEKGKAVYEENKNGKKVVDRNGKEIYVKGRAVIPRSHPLYQEYKVWQQINNVRIFLNTPDEKIDLFGKPELFEKLFKRTVGDIKQELFNKMSNTKTTVWRRFSGEALGIKDYVVDDEKDLKKEFYQYTNEETGEIQNSYFTVNFRKKKRNGDYDDIKLKGNTTKSTLQDILTDKNKEWFNEIHSDRQRIPNLQLLWEIIYDITNSKTEDVSKIIERHFGFDKTIYDKLASIKFDDSGMGNLSAKAIRQLLPLMSDGKNITEKAKKRVQSLLAMNNSDSEKARDENEKLESIKNFISDKKARLRLSKLSRAEDFKYLNYWEAAAVVYGSHSTKRTIIQPEISRVKQHSMNNPVVEKIVNETISIINEIYKTYGFDEVRIELSRELKASMEERQQMWEATQAGYEKNEWAKKMLRELKQALKEGNRSTENIDDEPSTKSNIDKIRIIEDVVKFQQKDEHKKKEKEFKLDEPSKAEIAKYLLWLEQNFKCPYTDQPIPLTDVFARGKVVEIEHILPKERYYSNAYSNKVITWRKVNQVKANNGNRTAYEFIVSKRVENSVRIGSKDHELIPADRWNEHVERMFPKGAKRNNLLRKEIPEDPIERTLKETQYINKKLKEKLAELVGESKVWVTSGSVTDILREKWYLNDVMKKILKDRFQNFKIPTGKRTFQLKTLEEQHSFSSEVKSVLEGLKPSEDFKGWKKKIGKREFEFSIEELTQLSDELNKIISENEKEGIKMIVPFKYATSDESFETKSLVHWTKEYNNKSDKYEDVERFAGYSKRVDHRHHALDALIIACTKQNHIQYINNLNKINAADQEDDDAKKEKYKSLKNEICEGNSSTKLKTPWGKDNFITDVKNCLNEIAISHKNTRLLISPSKHRVDKDIKSGKIASIRGEMHDETNYAKKNYFEEGQRIPVKKLIELIINLKLENQLQTMVYFKSFEQIIKEVVLKEKYQKILVPIFAEYEKNENEESKKLSATLCKEINKSILDKIHKDRLLVDSKTNKPLEWLSTYLVNKNNKYELKDKSRRPMGHTMDLHTKTDKVDNVESIANPRIKRIAQYRRNFIIAEKKNIDKKDITATEKNKLKRDVESILLYSNAIYEVRIKRDDAEERIKNHLSPYKWVDLKYFNEDYFDKIEYAKKETTEKIKQKLKSVDLNHLKATYITEPIFGSEQKIPVKKVRQIHHFKNLYEITPKRYVNAADGFMTYFFKQKENTSSSGKKKEREVIFLKFIDAVRIVSDAKPDKIEYHKLIEKERTNAEIQNGIEYELLFTLAKNDLVYLPESALTKEEIEAVDWSDKKNIQPRLYIVKDMNPSRRDIKFQQFYKADPISISKSDTKSLFDTESKNGLSEEVKYGDTKMLHRCIKVFTDKLGKKIVPYWKFPNGCWNNEKAKQLNLI